MKLLEHETLIARDHVDSPGGLPFNTKIIQPGHAMQWVAHGYFASDGAHRPIREWYTCDDEEMMMLATSEHARFDMAQEIIVNAIKAGKVRCVYVHDDRATVHDRAYELSAIPAEQFSGVHVTHEWDYGFSITLSPEDGDPNTHDAVTMPLGMWFLWDEIAALRPDYVADRPMPAIPAPVATLQRQPDAARSRARTGRRAKPHGKLLAIVMKRAVEHGLAVACALPDKTLGGWLVDAHDDLGISPAPSLEDAGRDARAIIDALDGLVGSNAVPAQ